MSAAESGRPATDPGLLPPFACTYSPELPELLLRLGCSLALTTYQSGKVILLSPRAEGSHGGRRGGLTQLPRTFERAMGLAAEDGRLAVATRAEVVVLANCPELAPGHPRRPGAYDALFLPRAVCFTGPLDLHDLAWGTGGRLYAVNTLCSCLAVIDDRASFTPVWQPPFVSSLAPDDRCHLNGLAMEGGRPRYVTAFARSDEPEGWREQRHGGGVVIEVESGEVVLSGLAMPHSPRLVGGELYLLASACGEVLHADPARGTCEVVAALPGFSRGLAAYGDFLFVGLSKPRPDHQVLGGLDSTHPGEPFCGLVCLHRTTGRVVAELRYLATCEEIYDVQVLPGISRPGLLAPGDPLLPRALAAPGLALWGRGE